MAKKPFNWRMWSKIAVATVFFGVGGPMFTAWITPSEEELRAKYNPELRKRSMEQGEQRQQEFDQFVTKLKEWSKSDKPIWQVAKEAEEADRARAIARAKAQDKEAEARKLEMRKEAGFGSLQAHADAAPPEPKQGGGWFSWFGGK